MNEYGIFVDSAEIAWVDSRFVAEAFDKTTKRYCVKSRNFSLPNMD